MVSLVEDILTSIDKDNEKPISMVLKNINLKSFVPINGSNFEIGIESGILKALVYNFYH
jgi:hypothetical protein